MEKELRFEVKDTVQVVVDHTPYAIGTVCKITSVCKGKRSYDYGVMPLVCLPEKPQWVNDEDIVPYKEEQPKTVTVEPDKKVEDVIQEYSVDDTVVVTIGIGTTPEGTICTIKEINTFKNYYLENPEGNCNWYDPCMFRLPTDQEREESWKAYTQNDKKWWKLVRNTAALIKDGWRKATESEIDCLRKDASLPNNEIHQSIVQSMQLRPEATLMVMPDVEGIDFDPPSDEVKDFPLPWHIRWDNKHWTMVSEDYDHSFVGYKETSMAQHVKLAKATKEGDKEAKEITDYYKEHWEDNKLIWCPLVTLPLKESSQKTVTYVDESANIPDPEKVTEALKEHKVEILETSSTFTKFDQGKSRLDLLPKSAKVFADSTTLFYTYLEVKDNPSYTQMEMLGELMLINTSLNETGKILAHGAEKYGAHNWKSVGDLGRYWGALGRHIEAMDIEGYRSLDNDSGLRHAAHALTNIMFLMDLDPSLKHCN